MAKFAKEVLSGSTDGRGIKVTQTATAGDTIHTAPSTATEYDEIWLWAMNSHTAAIDLTLEFGGVTDPDDLITETIAADAGLVPVLQGMVLKGNATPLVLKAFAGTANKIVLFGYVNAIT